MFVIRKKRRWIDDSPCWVIFFHIHNHGGYKAALFDSFDEVLEFLNSAEGREAWERELRYSQEYTL